MKTDMKFITAAGSAALLGFGALYGMKAYQSWMQGGSGRGRVMRIDPRPLVRESFEVLEEEALHPERHPEQTSSADEVIKMYQMAKDLTYLFDIFGVNAWVSGATLLGAIRHGGFIPWEPVLDFMIYTRDEPALGMLLSTNTLEAYGYQARELPGKGGWEIYMGAQPDVKAVLYWVEPVDKERVCPSGDLGKNLCDMKCGIPLEGRNQALLSGRPYYGSPVMANEVEPRRRWAFGMTEVYVPSQYEGVLDRTAGSHWRTRGDEPGAQPVGDNREVQRLPWYRVPRELTEENMLPARPIGPLLDAERGLTKYSRDVGIKGKY